jgi:hypothetical protein
MYGNVFDHRMRLTLIFVVVNWHGQGAAALGW